MVAVLLAKFLEVGDIRRCRVSVQKEAFSSEMSEAAEGSDDTVQIIITEGVVSWVQG